MGRLIYADSLIAEMHNIILEDGEDRRTFYEVIERQPTVDAVEVVRCMDCKYNIDNPREFADNDIIAFFDWCATFRTRYGDGAYCSFGKRTKR